MRDGVIVRYDRRQRVPAMRHIDYGLGIFRAAVFEDLTDGEPHDLADLHRRLVADGRLAAHEVTERFYEIGSPSGLADLRALLTEQRTAHPDRGAA